MASMAPYASTTLELANTFCSSDKRKTLFRGLLQYREALLAAGITDGFQWINGSFVEDVESTRGSPPNDIDVVTFAYRPVGASHDSAWATFVHGNLNLFDLPQIKSNYFCDGFYVDLHLPPSFIVHAARFWFGLFSHQRDHYLWKGLLQIPLGTDDSSALAAVSV